jgi:hypothetical protein
MVTQERLHELFRYDPETGELWHKKKNSNRSIMNRPVGCKRDGYLVARIDGKTLSLHRVIWVYVYGKLPEYDIDHINMDRADNRLSNLREATRSKNMMNTLAHRDSRSGVKGVCWHKAAQKWFARVSKDGGTINVGLFETKEQAAEAVQKCREKMHQAFTRH